MVSRFTSSKTSVANELMSTQTSNFSPFSCHLPWAGLLLYSGQSPWSSLAEYYPFGHLNLLPSHLLYISYCQLLNNHLHTRRCLTNLLHTGDIFACNHFGDIWEYCFQCKMSLDMSNQAPYHHSLGVLSSY